MQKGIDPITIMITADIILESERLYIKPLNYQQLIKYMKMDNSLELELGLNVYPRSISAELAEAIEYAILPGVLDFSQNYIFYTLWTMIDKRKNVLVGDLCFKGQPDSSGEIEIAYGTYPDFQNQGYITEAIGRLIEWVFQQPSINSIVAETVKDNIASQKALVKSSFTKAEYSDGMILWRLEKTGFLHGSSTWDDQRGKIL